jgi:hypothetical protein
MPEVTELKEIEGYVTSGFFSWTKIVLKTSIKFLPAAGIAA